MLAAMLIGAFAVFLTLRHVRKRSESRVGDVQGGTDWMIGLALSVMIQLVVLAIRLTIVAAVWTVRFTVWLIAAIASALSDRRRRDRASASSPQRSGADRSGRTLGDLPAGWLRMYRVWLSERSNSITFTRSASEDRTIPRIFEPCVGHATPRKAREL